MNIINKIKYILHSCNNYIRVNNLYKLKNKKLLEPRDIILLNRLDNKKNINYLRKNIGLFDEYIMTIVENEIIDANRNYDNKYTEAIIFVILFNRDIIDPIRKQEMNSQYYTQLYSLYYSCDNSIFLDILFNFIKNRLKQNNIYCTRVQISKNSFESIDQCECVCDLRNTNNKSKLKNIIKNTI